MQTFFLKHQEAEVGLFAKNAVKPAAIWSSQTELKLEKPPQPAKGITEIYKIMHGVEKMDKATFFSFISPGLGKHPIELTIQDKQRTLLPQEFFTAHIHAQNECREERKLLLPPPWSYYIQSNDQKVPSMQILLYTRYTLHVTMNSKHPEFLIEDT